MSAPTGYAEMFEWADGNNGRQNRQGLTVALQGSKIVLAREGLTPIGVIAKDNTAVHMISNNSAEEYHGKHLRDEYNSLVLEPQVIIEWVENGFRHCYETDHIPEGIVPPADAVYTFDHFGHPLQRPILSPDYAPSDHPFYIPRSERKEWGIVILFGRARIKDGCPVAPNWIRMDPIAKIGAEPTAREWIIR